MYQKGLECTQSYD